MNNDTWAMGWSTQNDEIEVDWNAMFQAYPEVSVHNFHNEFITKVEIPEWAKMDKDYHPTIAERFEIENGDNYSFVVTYASNSTIGGVGFKRIFIVEKSTQKPFQKMKGIWNELKVWSEGISLKITISDDGKLRNAFGAPSTPEIYTCGIVAKIVSLHNDWRKFPNESDYKSVENLKEAMNKISMMQMCSGDIEGEINESRRIIKEQQDMIARLEKNLNKLYEDGADAMNLLEEHGVKVDLGKNEPDDAIVGLKENYCGIDHVYPGQGILIDDPPPSGTLMSTLSPNMPQLKWDDYLVDDSCD